MSVVDAWSRSSPAYVYNWMPVHTEATFTVNLVLCFFSGFNLLLVYILSALMLPVFASSNIFFLKKEG